MGSSSSCDYIGLRSTFQRNSTTALCQQFPKLRDNPDSRTTERLGEAETRRAISNGETEGTPGTTTGFNEADADPGWPSCLASPSASFQRALTAQSAQLWQYHLTFWAVSAIPNARAHTTSFQCTRILRHFNETSTNLKYGSSNAGRRHKRS